MTEPAPLPRTGAWRLRAIRLSDRVPTKWLITALSTLFLVASAAFGGLNDVAAAPLPEITAGDSFTGAQLKISPTAAVLIDAFPEQSIEPAPGNRLLVVRATVENMWDRPVSTRGGIGAADNLRPVSAELGDDPAPLTVAIVSDGSTYPDLQPGVPIELAFIWEVPARALAGDDSLRVDILDKAYAAGGIVTFGERFDTPTVAAYVELPVSDVGAGVSAPAEDNG